MGSSLWLVILLIVALDSCFSCFVELEICSTRLSLCFFWPIVVVDVATQVGCLDSFGMLIRAYGWRPHGLGSSLDDSCGMPRLK